MREWVGSSHFHITPRLSTWSKAKAQLFCQESRREGMGRAAPGAWRPIRK